MAQKKDLNISPYYDDFESDNNFYKVLFKPGFPVQARELTTLQSIFQNQIEDFGSHMFKEGSIVIPGAPTFDDQFNAVKLNSTQFGTDVSLYVDNLIGKTIEGQVSGVTASVDYVALPDGDDVEDLTIYVKYINAGVSDPTRSTFIEGESLIAKENIVYGNTTLNAGTAIATLIPSDALAVGSAASVADGVYFIRGTFVNVSKQTIILDHYTNNPSYRVGLQVNEEIITAKDDPSLYDNAKGFTNYAAPGADRLKITLTLVKKEITDRNDTDFVEILRINNGDIRKITTKTNYNIIRDYLAERTFEESGNYSLQPFNVNANNSLNNRLGNAGLFYSDQTTEQGNTPSDDLMCYSVSGGEAYVRGYDVVTDSVTVLDVDKPREIQKVDSASVPFEMGSLLVVNNVKGQPQYRNVISLYDQLNSTGTVIGEARVYSFSSKDGVYSGASNKWNLRLFDIQTYTKLTLNKAVSDSEIAESFYVKGKSSGATGYATADGGDSTTVYLRQTSGTFIQGEQILINGVNSVPRSITTVATYGARDVKSVKQTASAPYVQNFTADSSLDAASMPNGIVRVEIASTTLRSQGRTLTGIKVGDILVANLTSGTASLEVPYYVRVTAIASNLLSATVAAPGQSVSGVYKGDALPSGGVQVWLGNSTIDDTHSGLYEVLPESNISSVDFSSSTLSISAQVTGVDAVGSASTISFSDVKDGGGVAISTAFFDSFNFNRYSYHYGSTTGVGTVSSDRFELLGGGSKAQFTGLNATDTDGVISITGKKQGIQSKIKNYERSQILTVDKSRLSQSGTVGLGTDIDDGLTYNGNAYGLRVQDESISLNVPDVVKVLAVYESLTTDAPTLDTLTFTATAVVGTNALIGEDIVGQTSNAIARVVTNNGSTPSSGGTNKLGIVYLNEKRFSQYEQVVFQESNINTQVQAINEGAGDGKYQNITSSFTLDKGQKQQFYDYSRLNRVRNASIPSRQLLVVYDYYTVPSNDTGDVFTVLSYDKERYSNDIPFIGGNNVDIGGVRATNTLDFRPRLDPFSVTTSSPFDYRWKTTTFNTSPKFLIAANESSLLGYEFYLGRIDKIYLSEYGHLTVQKGQSSINPQSPEILTDAMEIATLTLPPYLYNFSDIEINLTDNRRYTMRDIGELEDRIEGLEQVTTLSLLEVGTEALSIQDSNGRNRFKSGFFVDNFKTSSFIDLSLSSITVDNNKEEIRPLIVKNTLDSLLMPAVSTTDQDYQMGTNFDLLDSGVQKTGDAVTLKYDEVEWISQLLATRVENVNPFHVVTFTGNLTLTPARDTWTRTLRLSNRTENRTEVEDVIRGSGRWNTVTRFTEVLTSSTVEDIRVDVADTFMRSRNTMFDAKALRPFNRHYQFLDGISGIDVVPKLIEIANDSSLENYGSSGTFQKGETVKGYSITNTSGGSLTEIISFRVAQSNHKSGSSDNPTTVFGYNPYSSTETIQSEYTSSSKVLNVDTVSLAEESIPEYSGYITAGTKLVGQTSGAISYVKDIRLISDWSGDLMGTFFLKDPNTEPAPSVVVRTGNKTYRLSSSSTNQQALKGSKLISSAQTQYEATGTFSTLEQLTTNITTRRNVELRTFVQVDPLAQSFAVGGNIQAPFSINRTAGSTDMGVDDDQFGVFITAVDVFFATKPLTGSHPLTVELRTVELGTPTMNVIGNSVTLNPSDIVTSTDGETATNVTFPEPIYLPPGREYAVVLLAPTTDQYEVWIARMGETAVNTQNLPQASAQIYSQQWALGSLFKSQNGSIWSPSQLEDLKFRLYKAEFSTTPGTVFFNNPTINAEKLEVNPIVTFPKTGSIGITTLLSGSAGISTLVPGRTILGSTYDFVSGTLVGVGNSVNTVAITTGGSDYVSTSAVNTFNIIGSGSGLKLNTTATAGVLSAVAVNSMGNGYKIGDVVGIVTSSSGNQGADATITITDVGGGVDTLYLSRIQGTSVPAGGFKDGGNVRYLDGTTTYQVTDTEYRGNLSIDAIPNDGQHFMVNQFNHGMYAANNQLTLSNIKSNLPTTTLSNDITASENTTITIGSTTTPDLSTFEGIAVGAANTGYVKIDEEIIGYESVGVGIIQSITRGVNNTLQTSHSTTEIDGRNTQVEKYEINNVSLKRINITHDIADVGIGLDRYYIKIDTTQNGVNRSADTATTPQLSFNDEGFCGGQEVEATRNIQFDSIIPVYDVFTPSSVTEATASVRTVTGTSVDGSEVSFIDQGFESIQLNTLNELTTPRLICSKVNETTYLSNIERNKSFTTGITFSTQSQNVSPIVNLNTTFTEFASNYVNQPVGDYITDNTVKSLSFDPHAAVYVSNVVSLDKPADSLKVIFSADRPSAADFRVLYSLVRPDSNGIDQEFVLFPGYDNLIEENGDDRVKDESKNDGQSDSFVPASTNGEFLEYQYTHNNIGEFVGYAIKIVMTSSNQATPPRIKEFRSIAIK